MAAPLSPERRRPLSPRARAAAGALAVALGLGLVWARRAAPPPEVALPPVRAVAVEVDTLLLGGYARGSFREALRTLAGDLSPAERALIGQHLDKIFAGVLPELGLGEAGRLRLAYERVRRPDGSLRAVRVLAAETAVRGRVYTAFFFERDGRPGYFDAWGRSLDPDEWGRPLELWRISSPFAVARLHPLLRRLLPHRGLDLAAPEGTPVRAAADGTVSRAGWAGGYGLLVELQHANGYTTRYAHLASVAVAPGALVRKGTILGTVGRTGLATGPHLHFEVRRGGLAIDPLRLDPETAPALDLGLDRSWRVARQALAALLERAPTVVAQGAASR